MFSCFNDLVNGSTFLLNDTRYRKVGKLAVDINKTTNNFAPEPSLEIKVLISVPFNGMYPQVRAVV